MKRLVFAAPVVAFGALAFFLFRSLWAPPPEALPSALIDKPVPARTLPALDARTRGFGPKDFATGKVVIVNVFSSTCAPCRLEAPVLDQLARQPGITIFGFVWKDRADKARAFLDEVGDPFSRIGQDSEGEAGLEWGVYGWPETYVVDGRGIIRFKYVGALSEEVVARQLLPAVKKAQDAS